MHKEISYTLCFVYYDKDSKIKISVNVRDWRFIDTSLTKDLSISISVSIKASFRLIPTCSVA